jgi:hypothetical protein
MSGRPESSQAFGPLPCCSVMRLTFFSMHSMISLPCLHGRTGRNEDGGVLGSVYGIESEFSPGLLTKIRVRTSFVTNV